MFNKLHYDAKFQEMFAPATVIASSSVESVASGDKNIKVTDADRVCILLQWLAASVIKAVTITVYAVNAGGTGDTAIPFDIAEITETTGAYGDWTACTTAGHAYSAASNTDGTHMFLIEVDKTAFLQNDDFATPLQYLELKIASADADETGTITGSATAILYGLKYKNED